jgi:hypothetical protein
MPEGGELTFRTETAVIDDGAAAKVTGLPEGDYVLLTNQIPAQAWKAPLLNTFLSRFLPQKRWARALVSGFLW